MSEYTLWTCPRNEWNTMLDEIMQDIGRGEVSAIVEEALKQFRDEFKRRLNMTPIEKAAEESAEAVVQAIMPHVSWDIDAADLVDTVRLIIEQCHRRALSEEVPEKKRTYGHGMQSTLDSWEARAYNQARRDFLGKEG